MTLEAIVEGVAAAAALMLVNDIRRTNRDIARGLQALETTVARHDERIHELERNTHAAAE